MNKEAERIHAQKLGNRPVHGAWVFYLLLFAVVLLPLPFGAVFQWTWAGLSLLVGVLLIVSVLANLTTSVLRYEFRALWLPALLYLAVVTWVAVQASGLMLDAWGHTIWKQTAEELGGSVAAAISLNPYATRSELLKLLTYAGVFWLAVLYGRDRTRARVSLWILAVAGSLYAAYGLVAFFTGLGETLWRHEMPWSEVGVSSVFVNRNMYVDYAAFGLLAVLGLVLDASRSFDHSKQDDIAFWRNLLGGKDSHHLALLVMGFVILAALTLTGSRAGVLAAALASLVMVLLLMRGRAAKPGSSRRWIIPALAVLAVWLLIYVVAGAHLGSRLAGTATGPGIGRLAAYQMLVRAITEAPLTGYGAGNSYDVFYLFNDGTLWRALNYAHNIYLGAAIELGVPAAIVLFSSVGLVALRCLRGARLRHRDQVYPAMGVAISVHVALHGLFDSPLYLAANAATFSFLMGLAYTQSWPSHRP